MTKLEEQVKNFVMKSYTKDGIVSTTFDHQVEVAEILKGLNPNVEEALIIAALAHDIERATREKDMLDLLKSKPNGFMDKEFLRLHQERGALIIEGFLEEKGAPRDLVEKVKSLVSKHEIGGSSDSDLLKDADSLSFFNTRAVHFMESKIGISSVDKVRAKLDWMYNRITSKEIKHLAEPNYLIARNLLINYKS